MRSKAELHSEAAEKTVRDIRRATRRQYSAEEKVQIVIAGLRGEDSIAELCRKEGVNQNLYYRWSKDFLEAGKERLAGDTAREATSDEVKAIQAQARQLKELLAEWLMVCLSSNREGGEELLRRAGRTAAQLNADWYAVHVETPAESFQTISGADFGNLLDNIKSRLI
jgi:transposase